MTTNGRSKASPPYIIIAIVVVAVSAMFTSGFLLFAGSGGDEALIRAGLVTTFASTIIVTLVSLQAKQTHDLVNSTASELREVRSDLSYAQGKVAGIAEESDMPPRERG